MKKTTPALLMGLALAAAAAEAAPTATPAAIASPAPADAPKPVVLVLQDLASLRAAARDSSPQQAQLLRGEALEVRAERLDWLQVWDYGRERGGYVRRAQTLALAADPATLLAQLRVTAAQDGSEGLGVALAAAYIQAASKTELAGPDGAEVLADLGDFGARIAANTGRQRAGLLDVAARYGLRFENFEQADGSMLACYDGDAWRRVLSLPASAEAKARAALALTRAECRPAALTASQREASDAWRAEVLAHAPLDGLPGYLKNRLLLRRASVGASRAFAARDAALARAALADFARVEPTELPEDDQPEANDTAMRVNAMRWLALEQPAERQFAQGLRLTLKDGAGVGERCLTLSNANGDALVARCSVGAVMLASATLDREANALAIAVQPLDGWRELWVLRAGQGGWTVDVLPPTLAAPGLGYVEFAGWVPGGKQLLVVSESRAEGRYASRRFQQLELATLAPLHQAGDAKQLGVFQRWADPAWTGASLALR